MSQDRDPRVNYFSDGLDARRYARARPDIHSTAVGLFRRFAQIEAPLPLALDVGCGTGQSTLALTEVAARVIGIDPSADMLRHAEWHEDVKYRQSPAEHTRFSDGQFDIVSAAQAFHWFDHDAFLKESHRLLRVRGWLLVYTSWFTGEMKGEPAFADWFKDKYLSRYPSPPRDRTPITAELAGRHGFALSGEEEFADEIDMTAERFAEYQLSTTNVIAAVRKGEDSFDEAASWIRTELKPFFGGSRQRVFLFSGKAWYLERDAS
jgi:SAM-dependent methyltransferase